MQSWWCGPCQVLQQVGGHTYLVQVTPTTTRSVHTSQLKTHHEDFLGRSWPLHYTAKEDNIADATLGDYNVEKIVAHEVSKKGELKFLVRWKGYQSDEDSWEPPEAFLPQYCQPWVDYCKQHRLRIELPD